MDFCSQRKFLPNKEIFSEPIFWTIFFQILAHQVYVAGEIVIAVNEGNSNKLYKYNGSNYWDEVAQQTKSCCVSLDGVIYFVDQDGQVLQYRK